MASSEECGITFQRTAQGNAFVCDDCRDEEAQAEDQFVVQDAVADPVLLANLRDMGFGERQARLALEQTGNQNLEV